MALAIPGNALIKTPSAGTLAANNASPPTPESKTKPESKQVGRLTLGDLALDVNEGVLLKNMDQIEKIKKAGYLALLLWDKNTNPSGFLNIEKKTQPLLPKCQVCSSESSDRAEYRIYVNLYPKTATDHLSGRIKHFGKALQITCSVPNVNLKADRLHLATYLRAGPKEKAEYLKNLTPPRKCKYEYRLTARLTPRKDGDRVQSLQCFRWESPFLDRCKGLPNVVQVYDKALYPSIASRNSITSPEIDEKKSPEMLQDKFVVYMELGETVSTWLENNGVSPWIPKLAADYLTGLNGFFQRGIIHGDIKVDNLLVIPATKDGVTTYSGSITDFDCAQWVEGPKVDTTGSPFAYSPERFRGARSSSHLEDVYGMGLAFRTMLTGGQDSLRQIALYWRFLANRMIIALAPTKDAGPVLEPTPEQEIAVQYISQFPESVDIFIQTINSKLKENEHRLDEYLGKHELKHEDILSINIDPFLKALEVLVGKKVEPHIWKALTDFNDYILAFIKKIEDCQNNWWAKYKAGSVKKSGVMWDMIYEMLSPYQFRPTASVLLERYGQLLIDSHQQLLNNVNKPESKEEVGAGDARAAVTFAGPGNGKDLKVNVELEHNKSEYISTPEHRKSIWQDDQDRLNNLKTMDLRRQIGRASLVLEDDASATAGVPAANANAGAGADAV